MITNAILLVCQGFLQIILAPLTVLNFAIDLVSSIPVVVSFLQIVAYVIPWVNILPIIIFIIAMFGFRGILALVRLIKSFIPGFSF